MKKFPGGAAPDCPFLSLHVVLRDGVTLDFDRIIPNVVSAKQTKTLLYTFFA